MKNDEKPATNNDYKTAHKLCLKNCSLKITVICGKLYSSLFPRNIKKTAFVLITYIKARIICNNFAQNVERNEGVNLPFNQSGIRMKSKF